MHFLSKGVIHNTESVCVCSTLSRTTFAYRMCTAVFDVSTPPFLFEVQLRVEFPVRAIARYRMMMCNAAGRLASRSGRVVSPRFENVEICRLVRV